MNIGRYTYNSTAQQFQGQFPGPSTQNWNMVQATVTSSQSNLKAFAKIFNLAPSLQAVSTAAHRPRDICLILDYSGSMRFGSLLGLPYSGNRSGEQPGHRSTRRSGHYSGSNAGTAGHRPRLALLDANIDWTTSDGRPPIVQDFYTSCHRRAGLFGRSEQLRHDPGGDIPLKTNKNTGALLRPNAVGPDGC